MICKAMLTYLFVVAFVGSCGCSATTHSRHRSDRADEFVCAIMQSSQVANFRDSWWLLDVDENTGTAQGWIGENLKDGLKVATFTCSFSPCKIEIETVGHYAELSPSRRLMLDDVFTGAASVVLGQDWWAGRWTAYAGKGCIYVSTLAVHHDDDIQNITKWLSEPSAGVDDNSTNHILPIELAIPWLISRYYSPERANKPDGW